jgi:hypothetical protein
MGKKGGEDQLGLDEDVVMTWRRLRGDSTRELRGSTWRRLTWRLDERDFDADDGSSRNQYVDV